MDLEARRRQLGRGPIDITLTPPKLQGKRGAIVVFRYADAHSCPQDLMTLKLKLRSALHLNSAEAQLPEERTTMSLSLHSTPPPAPTWNIPLCTLL